MTEKSTSRVSKRRERKPVILLVEDIEENRREWLTVIRRNWSPQSDGACSREGTLSLLRERSFDFVILDRKILLYDSDDPRSDNVGAGDRLYRDLVRMGIAVAVLSGQEIEHDEPYMSSPPRLGFYSKPPTLKTIEKIVSRYVALNKG